jgi:hypothetical protein
MEYVYHVLKTQFGMRLIVLAIRALTSRMENVSDVLQDQNGMELIVSVIEKGNILSIITVLSAHLIPLGAVQAAYA